MTYQYKGNGKDRPAQTPAQRAAQIASVADAIETATSRLRAALAEQADVEQLIRNAEARARHLQTVIREQGRLERQTTRRAQAADLEAKYAHTLYGGRAGLHAAAAEAAEHSARKRATQKDAA